MHKIDLGKKQMGIEYHHDFKGNIGIHSSGYSKTGYKELIIPAKELANFVTQNMPIEGHIIVVGLIFVKEKSAIVIPGKKQPPEMGFIIQEAIVHNQEEQAKVIEDTINMLKEKHGFKQEEIKSSAVMHITEETLRNLLLIN